MEFYQYFIIKYIYIYYVNVIYLFIGVLYLFYYKIIFIENNN